MSRAATTSAVGEWNRRPPFPFKRPLCFTLLLLTGLLAPATEPNTNKLRPGDVLVIRVFAHEDLDLSVRVAADGTIRFPLCGTVKAGGLAPNQLAEELSQGLKGAKIEDAFVTVFVETHAPRAVFVLGQVKAGGVNLRIPPEGRLTVLQAVSTAGGFTDAADLRNLAVIRRTDKGKSQRLKIDAAALINGDGKAGDLPLKPGDTLVVPQAKPVSVMGMVNSPGTFTIDTSKTPRSSELISSAGGLHPNADRRNLVLMRHGADGKTTVQSVDMTAVMQGKPEQDVGIQPGDVLVARAQDRIFVLGEVEEPGAIVLEREIRLTATRAIAMAGGFTKVAQRNGVILVRGQSITELDLKKVFSDPKRLSQDKVLQPGDVIFVQESLW